MCILPFVDQVKLWLKNWASVGKKAFLMKTASFECCYILKNEKDQ